MRFKSFPLEFDIVSAGAEEKIKDVPGFNDEGLVGIVWDAIGYDKTVTTASIKIIPQQQTGLFGGDTTHTFKTIDSLNQNEFVFEGMMLRPGEDCRMKITNGGAGTNRFHLRRRLVYRDDAPAFAR